MKQQRILLLGGSGFVGKRVAALLRQEGHQVATPGHRELDLQHLHEAQAMPLLADKDVVVNCIGVMSRHADILETIHHHAPAQLAQWAQAAGVQRWVQLSALGADAVQTVAFVGSKGRGDAALCASGLQLALARPSVVYGRGGASCELFIKLAHLPILALPGGGRFDLQPVHVADVAAGIVKMVNHPPPHATVVNMTGSQICTLAGYLSILHQTLHRKPPLRVLPIPLALIKPLLPLTNILSNGILSPGSIALLEAGNCADNADFAALLARAPLAAEQFVAAD